MCHSVLGLLSYSAYQVIQSRKSESQFFKPWTRSRSPTKWGLSIPAQSTPRQVLGKTRCQI